MSFTVGPLASPEAGICAVFDDGEDAPLLALAEEDALGAAFGSCCAAAVLSGARRMMGAFGSSSGTKSGVIALRFDPASLEGAVSFGASFEHATTDDASDAKRRAKAIAADLVERRMEGPLARSDGWLRPVVKWWVGERGIDMSTTRVLLLAALFIVGCGGGGAGSGAASPSNPSSSSSTSSDSSDDDDDDDDTTTTTTNNGGDDSNGGGSGGSSPNVGVSESETYGSQGGSNNPSPSPSGTSTPSQSPTTDGTNGPTISDPE
jgi:hypothetical protein